MTAQGLVVLVVFCAVCVGVYVERRNVPWWAWLFLFPFFMFGAVLYGVGWVLTRLVERLEASEAPPVPVVEKAVVKESPPPVPTSVVEVRSDATPEAEKLAQPKDVRRFEHDWEKLGNN